jgi:phosphoserine phosphatase
MIKLSGRWSPPVAKQLSSWLEERSKQKKGVLAVFDFDNTCVHHDIGEALFHHLVSEMKLCPSKNFFERVGKKYHAQELQKIYQTLKNLPAANRKKNPQYAIYRKFMLEAYYKRIKQEGAQITYLWVVSIMSGMTEEAVYAACDATISTEFEKPLQEETVVVGPNDSEPLIIKEGVRLYPEILELMTSLKKNGGEVWVVSASNRWIIERVIKMKNLPVDNFIGMEVHVKGGELTNNFIKPTPAGTGKWEAIQKRIGRTPNLVAGDSPSDYEMLEHATDIALLIDHGNKERVAHAKKKGWLIQQAFEGI